MTLLTGKQGMWVMAVALSVGLAANAWAGTINIGTGAGTSNATGLNQPLDPVLLGTGSNISIYLQGSATVSSYITLALIQPNGDSYNPMGTATLYQNYGSGSQTGPTTLASIGPGTTQNAQVNSANTFLSDVISGFNSSNNLTNFQDFETYEAALGMSVSSFQVTTFLIATGALSGANDPLVNIMIPGGEPTGSIFAALTDTGYSTVWTNDGGVNGTTSAPEPATWLLLAAGLGLLGLAQRRRPVHAA